MSVTRKVELNLPGRASATLVAHHITGVGARVLCRIDPANLTADDCRRLAQHLILAACTAEAIERKEERRLCQKKPAA